MPAEATSFPLATLRGLGIDAPDLAAAFSRRSLGKGTHLLHAGDIWATAVIVETGTLRMYFSRRDGREFNKAFHQEGALLMPITQAMASQGSLFHLAAVEPTVAWLAPADALVQGLEAAGHWLALRARLLEALVTAKLEREHDLLTLDGRSRYQRLMERRPELCGRVPLSMLATFLGLTDVSLSRIRAALRPR